MTNKYALITLFIAGRTPGKAEVFIKFLKEVYVINSLKANILIGMDILGPERIVVDIPRRKLIFYNCSDIKVKAEPITKENIRICRVVRTDKAWEIPPYIT